MKKKITKIHFFNPPSENKKNLDELIGELLSIINNTEEMMPIFDILIKNKKRV